MSTDNLESPYKYGYPRIDDDKEDTTTRPPRYSLFLGAEEDMSLLEGGLYYGKYDHVDHDEAKEEKPFDPRLVMLLEFFRQLYIKRNEVFKKIFPGYLHDEFVETFKKLGAKLSLRKSDLTKARSLKRSFSVGSTRSRGIGAPAPLTLERFKVRTVVPGGGGSGPQEGGGQDGKGDANSGGSASK
ncbi:hypothetical protein Tsubulata_034600 [Turnera subulata]|uniref:Uncharacterized protein n=1 Tax=Turnera subulata TaxID=218843 RepID=A0A9Q0JK71_9ROSI|nr:hypothetical protein Tsubulata_034600 [Turnera subulata]